MLDARRQGADYAQTDNQGNSQLWVLPAPGSGGESKPYPWLQNAFSEVFAQISPDGKWLAYLSDESGTFQVYVRPFPGPGAKIQISNHAGSASPRWNHNGRELFYREIESSEVWVDVQLGPPFLAGQLKALFQHPGGFDLTPDGKRFLMRRSAQAQAGGLKVEGVFDWFEELQRHVPVE